MKRIALVVACVLLVFPLGGCSDDNGSGTKDTGGGGGDQGALEASVSPEGGTPDNGTPQPDNGTPQPDNGTPQPDQGPPPPDTGTPAPDTAVADSAAPDAGLAKCSAVFANCTAGKWVDARTNAALREVTWSTGSYKPKCLHIKTNQTVKFTGVTLHPITQVCGPAPNFTSGIGNTRNWKFTKQGTYGYEWPPGGSTLFQGAIKVTSY
jgi:plastocyanin